MAKKKKIIPTSSPIIETAHSFRDILDTAEDFSDIVIPEIITTATAGSTSSSGSLTGGGAASISKPPKRAGRPKGESKRKRKGSPDPAKQDRMRRAWENARAMAAQNGGKPKDYLKAGLKKAWADEKQQKPGIDIESGSSSPAQGREFPKNRLPVVTYEDIKAIFPALVARHTSDGFWQKNKIGSNGGEGPWDGLDLSDYESWEDGGNFTVRQILTTFLPRLVPEASYDEETGKIVYGNND